MGFFLASRKGIEPLTPGLGNLCSILLSYREVRAGGVRASAAYMIRIVVPDQEPRAI